MRASRACRSTCVLKFTIDIVLVRMTSDLMRPEHKRYGYSNAMHGVLELSKEGLRGLSRGLAPNTVRIVYELHLTRKIEYLAGKSSLDECKHFSLE